MTRQDFIDNITYWWELIDFCNENDCDICEDIVESEDLQEHISDDFDNFSREYDWTDIRVWLNDIDDSASYYCREGSFEYTPVDNTFDEYKSDVLAWCDDNDIFDEDEDEEVDDDECADPEYLELEDWNCTDDDFRYLFGVIIKS